MVAELKRLYLALVLPLVAGLFLAYGAKRIDLVPPSAREALPMFIAPCLFVLSVLHAIALPIFSRSLFAHRMRFQKTVSEAALMKFERQLLLISLATPYFILPAYLLDVHHFYFTATVIMALYAAYYFYPSTKRIQFDRRLFRVR